MNSWQWPRFWGILESFAAVAGRQKVMEMKCDIALLGMLGMLFRAGLLSRWDILLTRPNANMDGGGRNEWKVIRFFIWSLSIVVGTTWGMLGQMTYMQWKLGRVAGGCLHDVGLSEFFAEVFCLHLPDAFCALPHTERLCSGATGCSERWWQAREHRLACIETSVEQNQRFLPGPSATHAFFGWPLCWAWPAAWFTWPQARLVYFASNFLWFFDSVSQVLVYELFGR